MPSAAAKSKHPFPEIDSANLLQVLMIPACVGPGATTDVFVGAAEEVLVVEEVVVTDAPPDTPTQ